MGKVVFLKLGNRHTNVSLCFFFHYNAHIYIILFSCVFKYFIINSKRKIIQVGEDSEKNIHGRITRVWKSHFMKEALRITVKNTIFSSK